MDKLPSNNPAIEYFRLWQNINALYEIYAKAFGISSSTLAVVSIIYHNQEKCTQKTISEQGFLPKQTVNAVITDFLKKGIVELTESKSDRRTKTINLTISGKDYVNGITQKLINAENAAMNSLSIKQRTELLKSTNIYYNYLKKSITNTLEEIS